MRPLVSVVILNWNGKTHLIRCLASLLKVTYKPLEIIVVDNNSTDDSVSEVQREFPRVTVIANKINKGYSGGNNDGIAASRGKYVFILNNDTQVAKGFLEPLISLMERDASVGCVQPKLVYGHNHAVLNAVGSYMTSTGFLYHYGYRKPASAPQYNQRLTIYSAKGAAMLLRRSAVDEVGMFDEDFFIYFEETDLCHRLWLGGYKVVYEPKSLVYHYEAVDTHKQMTNSFIMFLSTRNRIASFIKNLSLTNLFFVLTALLVFDILLFLLYLGRLHVRIAIAVVSSLLWNVRELPKTLRKRRPIQKRRKLDDESLFKTIWRNPPLMYYYYLLGDNLEHYRHEPSLLETNRY